MERQEKVVTTLSTSRIRRPQMTPCYCYTDLGHWQLGPLFEIKQANSPPLLRNASAFREHVSCSSPEPKYGDIEA